MASKPEQAGRREAEEAAEQVASYLRAHPDFLARRPELWAALAPPRRVFGEGVADFQEAMIGRLRETVRRNAETAGALVRQRRDHHSLSAQVHKATLALMGAPDLQALVEVVTTDLASLLGVDAAHLCVEATEMDVGRDVAGVRCLAPGAVASIMGEAGDVALEGDGPADARAFGAAAQLVRSTVLVRFGGSRMLPPALLAVGTRAAGRFASGQGAELFRYLAQVLEHCLRARLGLPA